MLIVVILLIHAAILLYVYGNSDSLASFVLNPITWIVFFDLISYYVPYWFSAGRYDFDIARFFVVQAIAITGCAVGQRRARRTRKTLGMRNGVAPKNDLQRSLHRAFALFVPIGVLYLLLKIVDLTVGDLQSALMDFGRFYIQSRIGSSWLYYLFFALCFYLLYAVYTQTLSRNLGIVLTLVTVLVASLQGGRGFLIVILLLLLLVVTAPQGARAAGGKGRNIRLLLLIGMISVGVFLIGTVLRFGTDWRSYVAYGGERADWQLYFALDDTVRYVHHYGVEWLGSLQDFKYDLVPRYFLPDKPVGSFETRLLYPGFGVTNQTIGLYANLYLNFGIVGWVVVLPLFYAGVGALYQRFTAGMYRGVRGFSLAFLFAGQELWLKGGVLNSRLAPVYMALLLAVAVHRTIDLSASVFLRIKARSKVEAISWERF